MLNLCSEREKPQNNKTRRTDMEQLFNDLIWITAISYNIGIFTWLKIVIFEPAFELAKMENN